MSSLDLIQAQRLAEAAARDVAVELRQGFGIHVAPESKSDDSWDVVTKYDLGAERRLRELLEPFDPGLDFCGEEFGGNLKSSNTWMVDPIDGTGHFTRQSPMCTTMISLIVDDEVQVGVIYNFVTDEMFSCHRGGGTYLNGQPVRVIERALKQSYLVFEINTQKANNLALYGRLEQLTAPINVMAAGHGFVVVAGGRYDGRICKDGWGYEWDYAAGPLLVEEAGGKVTNIGTDSFDWRNFDSIAANRRVHAELTEGDDAVFPLLT